jgi:hypothetical protein
MPFSKEPKGITIHDDCKGMDIKDNKVKGIKGEYPQINKEL